MVRNPRPRISAIILSLCAALAQSAAAFVYPLSEESVREAYFLGRNTEKAAPFLRPYARKYPFPIKGPWVYAIDFRTPYAEAVRRAWEHSLDYSAQQAQKDYFAQPSRVAVSVVIYLTSTYGYNAPLTDSKGQAIARREEFWREFPIRVSQKRAIEPTKATSRVIYGRHGTLIGAEILLEFDASQFASGTAQVAVSTPDGQTVSAEFDLNTLQ